MKKPSFLTTEFFQEVCNRISQATGHNINVMDERGVIIASATASRIGELHKGAASIMSGEADFFSADAATAKRLNIKEGYNLPLDYQGQRIAVIGVTAPVDEAMKLAEVVRICADTILQDAGRELELKRQLETEVDKRTKELALEVEERRRAQSELLSSEQRMRDMASASSDWFWETDSQHRFVYLSDTFYELSGFSKEFMIGKTREQIMRARKVKTDLKSWQQISQKQQEGEIFRSLIYEILKPDGDTMILEISGIPVYNIDGEFLGYRGTGSDITQKFIMEESLKQSEKMASLGEMVAGVAHEVNTPIGICITVITHMISEIEGLDSRYQTGKMTRNQLETFIKETGSNYEIMLSNLKRSAELIKSFKQVAVDQSSEKIRRFDFKGYIQEILTSLKPKLHRTSHELHVNCPNGIIVSTRPDVFAHIITNFIVNSLVHAFGEATTGRIDICVIPPDNTHPCFRLVYKDNGKGMDDETRKRVYEPFYTTKRGVGTGLGMHIVFNMVTEVLLGRINCRSAVGEGVRFEIEIPPDTAYFTYHNESE